MNPLFALSPFITEANPEHREEFPELMWNLGFEMDCYVSAPRFESYKYPTRTHKDIRDQLLTEMKNWDKRNCTPSFDEFSELVTNRFAQFMEERADLAKEFAASDEGQFYIRTEYKKSLDLYSEQQIAPCQLYGRCVQTTAHLLKTML